MPYLPIVVIVFLNINIKVISCTVSSMHAPLIGAFQNNFYGFACRGDLILSEFQNQFCALSAKPRQKCKSLSLFNIQMPASLRFIFCVLVVVITINIMLIWLINSILEYTLE